MDPTAPSPAPPAGDGAQPSDQNRQRPRSALRGALGVAFPIAVSFLFSFLVGLAGLALGGLSSTASVSMPSTCRILSSGVDLRSSKVCELGLLNYRAKHVFYPSSKRRFRCHDDYYWASVLQVEYTEYFSGQLSYAVAEAPKEALPHNCRPDFGAAWSTTLKFKVVTRLIFTRTSYSIVLLRNLRLGSCSKGYLYCFQRCMCQKISVQGECLYMWQQVLCWAC
ncbi:OSJNBa0083N12.13-like protein [Zea mays]|uniref:OSJNBa0083N12.13-like protein n=1 Tax=Zea mays TaxID=4577 RepID=A0A1D6E0Q2_MAIZE|nr:OSJNBa0083N12.13-like protein [Zea mays]